MLIKSSIIIIPLVTITVMVMIAGCSLNPRQATDANKKLYHQHISSGDDYFAEYDYDNALEHYLSALVIRPDNPDLLYKIGVIYGMKHSRENPGESIITGRRNQKSGVVRHPESNYSLAVKYFRRAADLGHNEARQILRTIQDNIQHLDVKY